MSNVLKVPSYPEGSGIYPTRFWLRMAPYLLVVVLLTRLGPQDWAQARYALRLEGTAATVAWLTLAIGNLLALFVLFAFWFILHRRTDKYLAIDRGILRFGHNGLEEEFSLRSLTGLRFRNGLFKRWNLMLEFAQGKVDIVPEFDNLGSLLTLLFQHLGKPLFDKDPRRERFLWRVLRTEIVWKMIERNWWKTALISVFATWFGKMLADASPATDVRLDLWLAFNFLLPIVSEILVQRILLWKWKTCFRKAPGLEVTLPGGFSASVHRKVILGAVLVYLVVYFMNLSDLMLNS